MSATQPLHSPASVRAPHTSSLEELGPLILERLESLEARLDLLTRPAVAGRDVDVDTATLARLLGVSADTIRRHALELGGYPVGGERGRGRPLRFNAEQARGAWTGRSSGEQSQPAEEPAAKPRKPRRRADRSGRQAPLLPYRGQKEGR